MAIFSEAIRFVQRNLASEKVVKCMCVLRIIPLNRLPTRLPIKFTNL